MLGESFLKLSSDCFKEISVTPSWISLTAHAHHMTACDHSVIITCIKYQLMYNKYQTIFINILQYIIYITWCLLNISGYLIYISGYLYIYLYQLIFIYNSWCVLVIPHLRVVSTNIYPINCSWLCEIGWTAEVIANAKCIIALHSDNQEDVSLFCKETLCSTVHTHRFLNSKFT